MQVHTRPRRCSGLESEEKVDDGRCGVKSRKLTLGLLIYHTKRCGPERFVAGMMQNTLYEIVQAHLYVVLTRYESRAKAFSSARNILPHI